jgi:hypothetical protein
MDSGLRTVLKSLAEEAAYSSKGHFKSADWINISIKLMISVPLITSSITYGFDLSRLYAQIISLLGLLYSVWALIYLNGNWFSDRRAKHMTLGSQYLDLYKDIRIECAKSEKLSGDLINLYRVRISELDNATSEAPIGFMGRIWSRCRIKDEMNLNWIYEK